MVVGLADRMLAFIQRSFIICLGSSSLLWYTDLVMLSISVRHLLKANPQSESSSLRLLYLSASPWTGDVPAMTDKSLLDLLQ